MLPHIDGTGSSMHAALGGGELLRRYGLVLRRNPHGGGAEVGVREVMAAAAVARFTAETFAAELRDLDSDSDDDEGDDEGDEESDGDDEGDGEEDEDEEEVDSSDLSDDEREPKEEEDDEEDDEEEEEEDQLGALASG